jgi:hypothetical protein
MQKKVPFEIKPLALLEFGMPYAEPTGAWNRIEVIFMHQAWFPYGRKNRGTIFLHAQFSFDRILIVRKQRFSMSKFTICLQFSSAKWAQAYLIN